VIRRAYMIPRGHIMGGKSSGMICGRKRLE
jgi:hypothetical protein